MSNVGVTEEELIAKATGPRVTKEQLEANIAAYVIFNGADAAKHVPHNPNLELLTICLLTTLNGFTVIGQSACAWPANYDKDIGDRLALEDAKGKLWALMGYHLKQQIYEGIVPLTEPTWEDRLQNEKIELEERYKKLGEFIGGPLYEALPERDRRLLEQQWEVMGSYLNILVSRLIGVS